MSGFERWKPVFSVAELGGEHSAAAAAQYRENEKELRRQRTEDEEARTRGLSSDGNKGDAIAHGHDAASSTSGSDLGQQLEMSKAYGGGGNKGATARVAVLHGLNRPLFHIDLTSALQSAVANVEMRGDGGVVKGVGTQGF